VPRYLRVSQPLRFSVDNMERRSCSTAPASQEVQEAAVATRSLVEIWFVIATTILERFGISRQSQGRGAGGRGMRRRGSGLMAPLRLVFGEVSGGSFRAGDD
jgi:hypothetical protein